MKYSLLGSSDLSVSNICLGSMTWGLQNNQAEANQQIDYALSQDINFIDTAELYAVPPSPDTYGKTETIPTTPIKEKKLYSPLKYQAKVCHGYARDKPLQEKR